MAGVHCPTCEALVDAVAKFCLACGHDFTGQGPITSTGHDLAQLKDVIRQRDDLSMAEKFDMIAKIEEGANPIALGIAAAGDDDGVDIGEAFSNSGAGDSSKSDWSFGDSQASSAAVKAVLKATEAWSLVQSGDLNLGDSLFRDAMSRGMDASTHIHDVASGEGEGIDPDSMRNIPVLKPPKRSFCPKCGSDIHSNTMLQWRKWRDHSSEVVSMQLEASMETALIQVAAHYVGSLSTLKKENTNLESRLGEIDEEKVKSEMKEKLLEELREELKKELREEIEDDVREQIEKDVRGNMASRGGASRGGVNRTTSSSSTSKKMPAKKAAGGMFGAKKVVKKYEGDDPSGKPSWFLQDALDTIYDPHGTGKSVKRKTILARSADGNVRVEDVVKIYAKEGEEGLSELAWTSPLTKYIIEAYDSC
jgi:hypothetical protein